MEVKWLATISVYLLCESVHQSLVCLLVHWFVALCQSVDLLWQRANARNISFQISLRWPIHIINPVDKTKLSCYIPHRHNTTVYLETYPSVSKGTNSSTNELVEQLANISVYPVCESLLISNLYVCWLVGESICVKCVNSISNPHPYNSKPFPLLSQTM